MSEEKILPKGWDNTELKNVIIKATKVKSKEKNQDEEFIYIDIGSVDNVLNKITSYKIYKWINSPSRAQQIVEVGDTLFSTVRTYLKNIAFVDKEIYHHQIASSGFTVIRANRDKIIPKYLFYYSIFSDFINQLNKLQTGTSYPAVRDNDVFSQRINYPKNIQEQHQIVAKIEELFSSLDNGIQNLKTAQQQLKIYRQAVLKWAFEGKLTSTKNDISQSQEINDLPEGWQWVKLVDLCEIKRGKSKHRPRNEPSLFGGKYPFIQTGDIRNANGGYIHLFSQTYSELGLQQSKLWPKDTLCITIAANIGETAILAMDACFPDSIVGLVCNYRTFNKYINYFLISFKNQLQKLAPATAQKNINVDILEKILLPLSPDLETQKSIVAEIESRLSVCDKLEETIQTSLKQSEILRQSILKKAFSGQLIPQDPNDEPASLLLEKIQTERAKTSPKTRSPKSSKKNN